MKSKSKALERAVRSVLYTGAISTLAVSPMAMAQQEGDDEVDEPVELERQVVTGSRIKRIDLEDARPVVVITRDDIELSGQESVADVLRTSPINTFGSAREVSGNSFARPGDHQPARHRVHPQPGAAGWAPGAPFAGDGQSGK